MSTVDYSWALGEKTYVWELGGGRGSRSSKPPGKCSSAALWWKNVTNTLFQILMHHIVGFTFWIDEQTLKLWTLLFCHFIWVVNKRLLLCFYFENADSALTRKHTSVVMLTVCHQHIRTRVGTANVGKIRLPDSRWNLFRGPLKTGRKHCLCEQAVTKLTRQRGSQTASNRWATLSSHNWTVSEQAGASGRSAVFLGPDGAGETCPAAYWSFVGSKSWKRSGTTCSRARRPSRRRRRVRQVPGQMATDTVLLASPGSSWCQHWVKQSDRCLTYWLYISRNNDGLQPGGHRLKSSVNRPLNA